MNSILFVSPYRYDGQWVFDDPHVGLHREPFVSGIDTIIDHLVKDIPNAEEGFRMLFSAGPFPGYMARIIRQREEYGGNWYLWPEQGVEGWLCPALFKYFEQAPDNIYVRVEEKVVVMERMKDER